MKLLKGLHWRIWCWRHAVCFKHRCPKRYWQTWGSDGYECLQCDEEKVAGVNAEQQILRNKLDQFQKESL